MGVGGWRAGGRGQRTLGCKYQSWTRICSPPTSRVPSVPWWGRGRAVRVCPHLHWPGLLPSGGLRTHHPQSSMCRGTPLPSSAVRLSDHSSSHHLDRRTCGQPWEAARTAGGGGGGRGRRAFRKPGRVLLCSVTLTSSVTCTRVGTLFLYKVRE